MPSPLDDPFYYLNNFRQVLDWLDQRYSDLLTDEEQDFINTFGQLPKGAQAILVRMVMRKGWHFRASKLAYAEIPDIGLAAAPLLALGWIDEQALLSLDEVFGVLQKAEVVQGFKALIERPSAKKSVLLEALQQQLADLQQPELRSLRQWCPALEERLFTLTVMPLCDRLRLLYFGNLYQDWSEFVLADLGVFTYEKVEFSRDSRGLRSRSDIDGYLHLHSCREAFEAGLGAEEVLAQTQALTTENPWLERRRQKLLFQIGQHYERMADGVAALAVYLSCDYPGARARLIRVLELDSQYQQAYDLALAAERAPQSAAELQQVLRMLPRLRRKLGYPATPRIAAREVVRLDLDLPLDELPLSVEQRVQLHLADDPGPVYYVENGLINSLFGLLCWPAIFAPVPGAFFHPYQSGPVDLLSENFYAQRAALFAECLGQLDDERYKTTIRRHFASKFGVQSPFVFWGLLDETLLDHALECLPAAHLRLWFERLLQDIKANRAGMPDLIQFWPAQGTYRMIEVKGPGDRLQDNQLRWLDFCEQHQMPVTVCYVQWTEQGVEHSC